MKVNESVKYEMNQSHMKVNDSVKYEMNQANLE